MWPHVREEFIILLFFQTATSIISNGSGTRNQRFGFWKWRGEMGVKCKLSQAFPYFLPTMKNHQTCQKFGKRWRKAWFNTFLINPFFSWFRVPENPISGTPDPSLSIIIIGIMKKYFENRQICENLAKKWRKTWFNFPY